jgi:hypothetical protein
MATLLAHKPIIFKPYAGPPVSISRGQKARQADCAQDPFWNAQVIDLTTQEASEGIANTLKRGSLANFDQMTAAPIPAPIMEMIGLLWRS